MKVDELGLTEKSFSRGIRKSSAVIGDGGWYGCANKDVKVDPSHHDQEDVTWIYVIVKCKIIFNFKCYQFTYIFTII